MQTVHIRSFGKLLGDRLPVALHVDASSGVRIGSTLRGGAAVHEHRLARLSGAASVLRGSSTLIACVVVLFACSAPADAALGPPVIREPFTPLPCPQKPVSTLDYEGCLELTVLRSDSSINTRAAEIFRLIRSPAARTAFVQSEQTWLRYRRTSCSVQASVYVGGSAEPLAFLRCEASRNQTHLAELAEVKRALSTLGVGLGRGVRIDNSVFSTVRPG